MSGPYVSLCRGKRGNKQLTNPWPLELARYPIQIAPAETKRDTKAERGSTNPQPQISVPVPPKGRVFVFEISALKAQTFFHHQFSSIFVWATGRIRFDRMAAAAAWAVLLLAAQVAKASAGPAFLWAPENYGFSSDGAKELVHYETISPKRLAKSVLQEGGWSNLFCSREDAHKYVDVAIIFLGSKLQSSDISKDKQIDPALVDTLKLSFTSSEFSMAFPYVATTDDEKLENSLISGFAENCNSGFEGKHITYTDTCAVSGQDLKKHHNMDSISDMVMARMGNNPRGQTDLIVLCSGGFEDLHSAKSEGELLSELVAMLKKSGAKYTILYASQASGLLENPSNVPLGRFLAEKTNTTKVGLGKCEGECLVKSTLLEGTFVGIVFLIILISGLMCMMGIDTPSRFEAPQES